MGPVRAGYTAAAKRAVPGGSNLAEHSAVIRWVVPSGPTQGVAQWARGRSSVAALVGYTVLSVVFFGVRVLAHPGVVYSCGLPTDPQVFIWSLAWWPHAILHGQNPLVTKEIWAPVGINLAWVQGAP